ncbi:conserved hypothetical protein [Neospora caninum Liverpool]|uniref:Uncharacterized protein n=1 Tax=Neospora caninum (strain Liverpool) TaxID=572307 RepID=F0VIL6_NEOCL|nr:conserved hypothetical protein [Neospora caninum Liverpool]CBZ53577.1 conserved hypothetical protein [Neospora caninum Liverpool]|eukprot:XP_003883609.1 conserved hypothetical protein [Neospora caninum Liverpool]
MRSRFSCFLLQDTGSKGTLNKEIQAFIQALRSCSFKPLCSLAVTLLPTEELASATPGPKAMDSPAAEVSNQGVSEPLESVNDSPATVVLMYKESDGQSFQLLASVPSRFLSLALHNLYLDGWGSPEPRYQSISRRFREGARKLLEAKVA